MATSLNEPNEHYISKQFNIKYIIYQDLLTHDLQKSIMRLETVLQPNIGGEGGDI